MSATDELRKLLDERGVEWWESANLLGCVFTRWHSPLFGDEVCAMENGEDGLVLFEHYMSPEQVIEATLGRGTCHNDAPEYLDFLCSECGFVHYHSDANDDEEGNGWSYCPNCGRKVVDE